MEYRNIPDIRLRDRDARELIFRNFSGKEQKFNPAGRRSFTLVLEEDLAQNLKDDGWNVREKENRDGDTVYHLQVFVDFSKPQYMPRINMIRSNDKKGIAINESNAQLIDSAEIESFDVRIRPYQWETAPGTSGVKAFVKSMNIVVEYDDIADRYTSYDDVDGDEELPFI